MKKYFSLLVSVLLFSKSFSQTLDDRNNLSSILNPSLISVTIGGDFIVNGTFPASMTERVDQFITRIYNEARENVLSKLTSDPYTIKKTVDDLERYSLRNIQLKRASGEKVQIDLIKFRRTGDFSWNPYLKNDDVIIFAPSDLERNFFQVSGAVNNPGKFNFVEGDKLSDALELAQGINNAYENVDSVEINRLSYDGETLTTIKLNISSDINLQRGDRIVVLADETQRKEFSVSVFGEVNFPGKIAITKNSTTLQEVLTKTGGVTNNASLKRAKLFTGNNFNLLIQKLYNVNLTEFPIDTALIDRFLYLETRLMDRMSSLNPEERYYFSFDNEIRILTDGTSVNFTDYDKAESEAANYIVRNGDIIIIPPKLTTIQVFGQVTNPGRINYISGKDIGYYIEKAGGLGEYAVEDEIILIKGESRKWISIEDQDYMIEPGDYIWIPREIIRGFNYYIGQIGTYLGIVASAATIILLLIQLNPKN
jgi:protein involved in polysaccharide export with SLBB domain